MWAKSEEALPVAEDDGVRVGLSRRHVESDSTADTNGH